MEPEKNGLSNMSYPCFARNDRKHCSHYEEDGYCCNCLTWAPEMCQEGCGQPQDQHLAENCTPLIKDEELELDLVSHLRRQQAFSFRTFGPPGEGQKPEGVIAHIEKEIRDELKRDPTNLREWVDLNILAFDGAMKAGYSPEQIVRTLVAKQSRNERRTWPDWRTMPRERAIEHVRTEEEAKIKSRELEELTNSPSYDANGSPPDGTWYCVDCGVEQGKPHQQKCQFY